MSDRAERWTALVSSVAVIVWIIWLTAAALEWSCPL
jgi:hypothetical protein